MDPVTFDNLIAAVQGRASGPSMPASAFAGVSLDSRTVERGEVFWAVTGESHDGHDFVEHARKQGAAAAVVSREVDTRLPLIQVDNTIAALGQFAQWYREQQPGMVIGVTGSVGKTTTRRMIHSVLGAGYRGIESPRNYNNHLGVPLSLLAMSGSDDYAVVEVGASAAGEILALGQLTRHEIAVITAISEVHLDGFGTLDRILSSKAELLETLTGDGFAVLNGDCPQLQKLAESVACPVLLCGTAADNHFRAELLAQDAEGITFRVNGEKLFLPALGAHHLVSAAMSVAIASEIGMSVDAIAAGFRAFRPAPGRCERIETGVWTIIDDTYNASPLSMQAACRLLDGWNGAGRRFLVLGDMLELGVDASRFHRELGRTIAEAEIDFLIAHGEFAEDVAEEAGRFGAAPHQIADCPSEEIIQLTLDCWLQPGDVVLVKGSRGMRMERIVAWLKARAKELSQGEPTARLRACA